MFNEAIRVASITGSTAKPDFQRSEWTQLSSQFNEDSPADGRDVD
ncbi:hypothetical protein TPL01_18610 [Sulfuriferula plumbiphila]|uniref:Uncharacterized protein n=1 Tax=Sulfuriferula plumbiphila TaxID=171865 RepID=A0A512L8C5_9PROT|nr:hypothetical protein [Sulfuriferula plumbiphila]BBP05065.1 hypothetical protein SFPGR_24870 [Sulfuriferula plumbiphila]GEP30723.1 hypothetical protein TPL01_18610 [Sulfuriferula plumbiphila]